MPNNRPIGIFDSGMGGLTFVQALMKVLPHEHTIYVGDSARLPYGQKTLDQVRQYSLEIVKFLLDRNAKAIVVACNTATAAAVNLLRKTWPDVPIIGMEPAVKPAAQATQSGVVGVLATQGTFASQRYAGLMRRYGKEVTMMEDPCLGLVELIEGGKAQETETLLHGILTPMLEAGADTFVLGCTHYPFAETLIRKIVGSEAHIIDPAPAVARHLKRRLATQDLLNPAKDSPERSFYATGDAPAMQKALQDYLHLENVVDELSLNG